MSEKKHPIYEIGKLYIPCIICGERIESYISNEVVVCEDCKKAIAYVKKTMEKENEKDN